MRHRILAFAAAGLVVCAGRAAAQEPTSAVELGTITLGHLKIQPSVTAKDVGRIEQ